MAKHTTETGRTLVPEGHYIAMINNVKEKDIPGGYIVYEWSFEIEEDSKAKYFSLSMFSSQMAELLHALGCQEVTKNKFEWEDDQAIGNTIEFNICHVADKKGVVREQMSDIKLLTKPIGDIKNPDGVKSPEEIVWND